MENSPGLHKGCSRTITYQGAHSSESNSKKEVPTVPGFQLCCSMVGRLAMAVYDKDQPKILWQDSERV